jgi:hypothetical protein
MLIDHHVDNTIEQELSPPIPELKSSDVRSWVHYGRDPRHPLTAGISQNLPFSKS